MISLKRVLIKLSGELLSKDDDGGLNIELINNVVQDIETVINLGIEVAIVIGGGNILRGSGYKFSKMIDRTTVDSMGMLVTIINSLALRDIFLAQGIKSVVLSAKSIDGIVESKDSLYARELLGKKNIVIFSGGTGNPFVTTDSAASLRACEIRADAILKATNVDGIYDKDPKKFSNVKRYRRLRFSDIISKELAVMDLPSFIQCRDFNIPICVFSIQKNRALERVVNQQEEGTWII